jgi:hypothetical protein
MYEKNSYSQFMKKLIIMSYFFKRKHEQIYLQEKIDDRRQKQSTN